jgi:formylglycine-generating enzyme required for sulfatase activity
MDFLASMRGLLGDLAEGGNSSRLQEMLSELDKTRGIIDQLLQEKGEGPGPSEGEEDSDSPEDIEEIELGEGEEIVVVGGQQGDETETGSGVEDTDEPEDKELYEESIEDTELVEEEITQASSDDEFVIEELIDDEDVIEELLEEDIEEVIEEDEIFEEDVEEVIIEEDEILEAGDQAGDKAEGDEGEKGGEQNGQLAGQGQGIENGQFDDGIGSSSEEQDFEILDAEDVIEELLEEDVEEEAIEEDEILEEYVEEKAIEEFETVEVEAEEIIEVEADSQGQQLDLSRYIEPSEALDNLPETLTEGTDELLNMIMQRFMPPFIQIPAGSYRVGCENPKSIDRPEQSVILKKYHISQIPVTNDIFDFFIRETGYETDAEKKGHGTVVEGRFSQKTDPETGKASLIINPGVRFQHVEGANWRHPKGPHSSLENKASHPVVQISRRDAIAFASWAGKKLPSEDEWEAAARGLEGRLFPWGDEWKKDNGNFESSQIGDTTQVTHFGKQSMSPFGLLDMLGNVMEWTSSHVTFPGKMDESSPKLYILKGGSWATGGTITAASRFLEADTWSNIIGFRCAV